MLGLPKGEASSTKLAETRDRAGDLQIFSLTLSQLSYRGHAVQHLRRVCWPQLGLTWSRNPRGSACKGSNPQRVVLAPRSKHTNTFLEDCAGTGTSKSRNASAGNRARVTSMATMYSATRPLMLLSSDDGPASLPKKQDSLAEWSKALAQGASPQGRGFEPHSCQLFVDKDVGSSDSCGVRTHALADWRLKPAP